jgi:type IV pilus assembly protein PilO
MKKVQQKWIAIGIGVVGIIYLYFSFLLLPTLKKIQELKNEKASSKQVLEEAVQKVASLVTLENDALRLKKDIYYTVKRLPIEEDMPGLLKTISSIAVDSYVNVNIIEPQKQVAKDFYSEMPFKLNITSSYHKIGEFLNNLSYNQRLITVKDIQLTQSVIAGNNRVTVSAVIILNSYVTKKSEEKTTMQDSEQKLFAELEEIPIKPVYLYEDNNKRDPFKPLSIIEISVSSKPVVINTLRLTGIISFSKVKTATLEDSDTNKYTLTNGTLYANDMRAIDDVYGTIENNKVILKQVDKTTKKLRTVVLEMKKENP